MKIRFFDPGLGYLKIKREVDAEMQRVLAAGDLILREEVEKFEEKLAHFVGTEYAIALNSGTDAIYLSLKAAGVGPGDFVSIPSHTFKATCGAVLMTGAKPIIHDMDGSIDQLYGQAPKAVIPVHIAGELSPIPNDLIVIEDACQALGAVKNPTSFSQCWSFYPAKILGAYGDAGAVTTNNKEVATYIRKARNHFKGNDEDFGINSRMDNLQAAILNIKFKYLPEFIKRRKDIAEKYYEGLKDLEKNGKIKLPNKQKGRVYQDFILKINE